MVIKKKRSLSVDGKAVVYGVTSMALGCAIPNRPGAIFAKVYAMIDFIQDILVLKILKRKYSYFMLKIRTYNYANICDQNDGILHEIFCQSNNAKWGDGICNTFLNTKSNCYDGGDCNGAGKIQMNHCQINVVIMILSLTDML